MSKNLQDYWAARTLYQARIVEHSSPNGPATGLLSLQLLKEDTQSVLTQLFWDTVLPSNWRWGNIFHEKVKCLTLYISCFLCTILNRVSVYGICKRHILFNFTQYPNLFGIWVVITGQLLSSCCLKRNFLHIIWTKSGLKHSRLMPACLNRQFRLF